MDSETSPIGETSTDRTSGWSWSVDRRRIIEGLLVLACLCLGNMFVAQMYSIPSGSMESTIGIGDRVIVDKTGLADIERGDIVVFRDSGHWEGVSHPSAISQTLSLIGLNDPGNHLIKRVIGLPGDHVSCTRGSNVSVNGTLIHETYLKKGTGLCNMPFDVHLKDHQVWVMGDNRMVSYDSRFNGPISKSSILGVCQARVWPLTKIGGCHNDTSAFSAVKKAS